jgi:hypothetical protein
VGEVIVAAVVIINDVRSNIHCHYLRKSFCLSDWLVSDLLVLVCLPMLFEENLIKLLNLSCTAATKK